MKTRFVNKLAAFTVLVSVCNKSQSVWTSFKAFKNLFQKFSARVDTLSQLKLKQETDTTGLAEQKQHCREEACAAAAVVAGAVGAWAEDEGNLEVAAKVNYSYSDLLEGRDTATKDKCQTVHDVAEQIVDELEDEGVNESVLADLQAKIDNFFDCITKPREAIATGKTVTKQIDSEFLAADRLLSKGLDGLSLKFKKSAPALYQDYWNARRIVDIAATHDTAEEASDAPKKAA